MNLLFRLLRLDFLPFSSDLGLLLLRLWLGLSLLILHGWTKLSGFQQMSGKFPDPLGIGTKASLSLAVFGEVVGSILIVLGLFTRFAALSSALTMGVAFLFVHRTVLKGPMNGELAFIYMGGFLALFLAGPGRFAVDGSSGKSRREKKRGSDQPRRE